MRSPRLWPVHGYAIICQNDCIATQDGRMPDALKNEADWTYFQSELDTCQAVLVGRMSHQVTPNRSNRLRIIMSRQRDGLVRDEEGWWWNPKHIALRQMQQTVLPGGGKIGVPGGQGPFDYFLQHGFAEFHLSRAETVAVTEGRAIFSRCDAGTTAEDQLAQAGLHLRSKRILDAAAQVSLQIWRSDQI